MCGRFTIQYTWAEYYEALNLIPASARGRNDPLRYDVCPGQKIGTLVNADDGYDILDTTWGLIPFWAKVKKRKAINVRGETVHKNGMFNVAFKHKRCLIPANSSYEWIEPEPKNKLPFNIHLRSKEPYFFAGIWARNDALETTTCAIITTSPHRNIAEIHDRMPIILKPDVCEEWMSKDTEVERALELLHENQGADLVAYRVSKVVNKNDAQGPELIEPIKV